MKTLKINWGKCGHVRMQIFSKERSNSMSYKDNINIIPPSVRSLLYIVEIIEFSQEEIERLNQTHEDGIRKRANFGGTIFLSGKIFHVDSLGNINLNLGEMLSKQLLYKLQKFFMFNQNGGYFQS